MRLTHVKFGCLLASVFLSLTWFTAYNGNDKGEPPYDPKMIQLYERLLAAESRGELVYRELSSLLTSLRNLTIPSNNSSTNITEGLIKRRLGLLSPRMPNAYLYLPHLRDHADSLNPNVVLGQGRTGVSLVLGIPTVKRQKQSYLVSTLNSLLYDLSPSEREDTVIIVFVAEMDAEYVNTVAELIKHNFPKDVHSGLLEVVSPSQYFYPNFHRLRETFGDSKDRVKWRTKQNLDYSFLMLYAHEKGTYYVQLEDDIVAKPGYSQAMKTYVRSLASDDWMFLEFSQLGFIGKMFRARDLPMIAEFFLMFHKDKPIDWLLDHILWVKACNPEKDAKDCNLQKGLLKLRYKPSLFQHVGLHSSLPGKVQKLKDKDFGKVPLFAAHSNPPAELSSSLKHYQQHTLERAYEGQDFFWGLTPTAEDFILLSFPQPRTVTGYLFRSGNIEINGDKFYNTTVEVLPSDSSVRDRLVGGQSPQYEGSYGGFIVIGSFVDGMAEGQIDAQMQPISALRLLVHSNSDVWVLLSEDPITMELEPSPPGLEAEYRTIFTAGSLVFLQELVSTFDEEVDKILRLRISRKTHLDLSGDLPGFCEVTAPVRSDPTWRVRPVPQRLQRRHVDVGDLAPCDTQRFIQALSSPAQGLQIDFDDGNCPTYHNQIKGIYNVYRAVHNQFPNAPKISQAPVLMLRPRAWNMVEHNMMVKGKEVPGPLCDFGFLMFHCGKLLFDSESGPFFYLSKVESYLEARLWNNIFLWTEQKLGLPVGSIKATVLIENVLSAFEMEEILYELKDHSAGLNCGIWDYSASFVNKFGHRGAFLLPDRSKYVNMEKLFLRSYMDLLVQTCHRRGALATGGMAALLLPQDRDSAPYRAALANVTRLKLLEIKAGVDGFMVYDLGLIEPMQKLFKLHSQGDNQMHQLRDDLTVTPDDLLCMPAGGVTLYGLKYNIAVGILFIDAWLKGKGHFFYRGQVEDSATAEISRSQVWQWIRHQTQLEDDSRVVTRGLVTELTQEVMGELKVVTRCHTVREEQRLLTAAAMFLEVVQKRDFPEFLTTYLNLDHTFLSSQAKRHEGGAAGDMPRPKL